MPEYRYIAARDQRPRAGNEVVKWIVIHSMEAPERGDMAESCANYFRNPPRPSSVHFCADDNSVVQTALLTNTVAGAIGANRNGIHIEQAGYAKQSGEEWSDSYSSKMIEDQVGPLVAKLCAMYGIPMKRLSVEELKAGHKGIVDHKTCSDAFGGDHWDPGPNYPWNKLIDYLGDDMPITDAEMDRIADKAANRTRTILGLADGRPGVVVADNISDAIADIQTRSAEIHKFVDKIFEHLTLATGGNGNTSMTVDDVQNIVNGVRAQFLAGLDNQIQVQ
jgi:N-acetyl-anhydromuramyl-L-alanine amidase AmpD